MHCILCKYFFNSYQYQIDEIFSNRDGNVYNQFKVFFALIIKFYFFPFTLTTLYLSLMVRYYNLPFYF